jgi:hypothetical protein
VKTDREAMPPMSRRAIRANSLVAPTGFATGVESDQPIVAERATYFDSGRSGTSSPGLSQTSPTWLLGEGVTRAGFDTWLLVENPGGAFANTRITLMTDTGATIAQPLLVSPHSRASLYVNLVLANSTFGIRVDSDQPIAAERTVYTAGGTVGMTAPGVTGGATEWLLPAGSTLGSAVEQLTVLNPQAQPAHVEVDFIRGDGQPSPSQTFQVGATTAQTLDVNAFAPDADVSLRVLADQPVVVERSSFFIQGGGQGATDSPGMPRSGS